MARLPCDQRAGVSTLLTPTAISLPPAEDIEASALAVSIFREEA